MKYPAKLSENLRKAGFIKFRYQILTMKMLYNPKYLGDRKQAWKCFLTGSLATSSFVFLATTENVLIFICNLILIAAGLILFTDTNMNRGKMVYLFQNIASSVAGLLASLFFHVSGFLIVYFVIIVILVMVTWLQNAVTGREELKAERRGKNSKPCGQIIKI